MEVPILFQDQYFVAVDKPSGMVVNRSENAPSQTLQDWARNTLLIGSDSLNMQTSDFHNRSGIVHRLDRETSGILLIAKNEEVFSSLQKIFFERNVEKKYLTLVHGKLSQESVTVKAPVGRLPWNRRKFGVLPQGREAETHFQKLKYYKDQKDNHYTLIEAKPTTGRTHQIRIHLKHLGYSIVGDDLYAGRKLYREDLKICPRLFLHAYYLSFMHPVSGGRIELKSDLPVSLVKVLDNLILLE